MGGSRPKNLAISRTVLRTAWSGWEGDELMAKFIKLTNKEG